ncbi:hypothetical protein RND81_02G124900 [Saponaria officinalis]|uniref:RING-type domain-containing protein n=1 Tax=Saponaria officinalis TaxID=3572 RepID=A0AAW1MTN0_SAPOF
MGFPVGYTDLLIPPLFLHTLTFLALFHSLLVSLVSALGLIPVSLDPNPTPHFHNPAHQPKPAKLLLPLMKLSDVEEKDDSEYCAVCLYEVCDEEEIRWLDNCRHIFHRNCIDRWIELDHDTCPLCRTPFLRRDFVRRLFSPHYHHVDDDDDEDVDVCFDLPTA